MASNVEIANRALTKIGANRIISLTDNTKEGRTVNSMYAIVRDAELRARTWRFAIKRAQLAALAAAPEFGFAYQYRAPADCLRVVDVGEFYPAADMSDYVGSDTSTYAYENGVILTDEAAPLKLRYVARIEDPTLFDALFVEAFACKLAMEMAEPITQSSTKRELATREYKDAVIAAMRANAIEKPPVKLADDTFILARL
jgi:hypothetical protein